MTQVQVAVASSSGEAARSSGEAARSSGEAARLRSLLLSLDADDGLAVSADSVLTPLNSEALHEELRSPEACETFVHHRSYQMPCDTGGQHTDTIHCFTLASDMSARLNPGLMTWALQKEKRARSWGDAPAGRGHDASAKVSNDGGYQSFHDLFAPPTARDLRSRQEMTGRKLAHKLHVIASQAVDEVMTAGAPSSGGCLSKGEAGDLHLATAWVNVNKASDTNHLHVHEGSRFQLPDDGESPQPSLWCAVYYIHAGSPTLASQLETAAASDGTDDSPASQLAGHMLFRGGDSSKSYSAEEPRVLSYLAVPPVPGCLWLFPGSIPHAVLGRCAKMHQQHGDSGVGRRSYYAPQPGHAESRTADGHSMRISLAMNFKEATCEPPKHIRGFL